MNTLVGRAMLVRSGRGRITLPAATRKRVGICAGDRLAVEEREGVILLSPARAEDELYSDAQIAE